MVEYGSLLTVLALVATIVVVLARLAPLFGLLDHPDKRKVHDGAIPLVGGLAIYTGLVAHFLIFQPDWGNFGLLLLFASPLVIVGVVDDRLDLGTSTRFFIQISVALMMVYSAGIRLDELGSLGFGGVFTLGIFAVPMTIIGTVGVINAVNFSDGLDGLAGGLSVIALLFMAVLAGVAGNTPLVGQLLVLVVAIIGFLLFNARYLGRSRAMVFLGDAGSMLIGFVLAWYFIGLSQGPERLMAPVTALWIFALPLFDTVGIMLRRLLQRRSPFSPDREHLHHILERAGFTTCQTVNTLLALATVLGGLGVAGELLGIAEGAMFLLFLALFGVYFWAMMRAWRLMKVLRVLHNEG